MPNRILKESICTSKELANISLGAEVLFFRLIVKADDFGCYHGDAEIIRNTCFAKKKSVKESHVVLWIDELINSGLIKFYTNKDIPYLHLTTFGDHQQQRARNPKYPLPTDDNSCNQMQTVANPLRERDALCENDKRERDALCGAYGEFKHVFIKQEEYAKLLQEYGQAIVDKKIKHLDTQIENGIKKYMGYKNHYATIGNWCETDKGAQNGTHKPIDPCIKEFPDVL